MASRRGDSMGKFVVKLDQVDGDEPEPDVALLVVDADGRAHLRRPACFRGLGRAQLRQLILDVVALKAAAGSMEAARLWLAESRWLAEMKKGKAPSRLRVDSALTVTVVDDLSAAVAGLPITGAKLPGSTGRAAGRGEALEVDVQLGAIGDVKLPADRAPGEAQLGDRARASSSTRQPDK